MGIFTTREIVIFTYAIILLMYVLLRKRSKEVVLPVIKAALHIKLIIPFVIILSFALLFIWLCSYLSIWNWIYVKDILLWTLFAGVPVCFNATKRKLEEHYFRNIIFDNLKFVALVEFLTGTFTFNIVIEFMLQPVLVLFVILQSSLVKKSVRTRKIVDGIIGAIGLAILGFTIKSIVESIGDIQFVDITVGLLLPIILSITYLPVAYFLAVYSKYELLFMRMSSKESDDRKVKIKHRIELIRVCKLSYKRVCRFLYEYLPKMYVTMENVDFATMIDEFRETTEHT